MENASSRPTLHAEAERPAVENNDPELVARCQRGDTQAFDELVTKYRSRVHSLIYNMVHNEQDAWDLAQDAFVKAWKSIARFRGQSSFYTCIYRIATNVTIDWVRKRKAEGGVEFNDALNNEAEPGSMTSPKQETAPADKLGHDEIRKRIDAAVEKLTPEHRAVILMREMDGLSYEEIAQALECSLGTVMSRLFYARKKLQSMLKDLHENI
jgi:RNA polymerase sigma-70 factor (ECF subfamily)